MNEPAVLSHFVLSALMEKLVKEEPRLQEQEELWFKWFDSISNSEEKSSFFTK